MIETKVTRAQKYARFNEDGEHFNIDIPDGSYNISARTSSGKRITFAFVPYEKDGEGMCVDIVYHGRPEAYPARTDGELNCPKQRTVLFGRGPTYYHSDTPGNDHQITITTILIDEDSEGGE